MTTDQILNSLDMITEDFNTMNNKEPSFDGSQLIYVTEQEMEAIREAKLYVQSFKRNEIAKMLINLICGFFLALLAYLAIYRR